VEQHNCVGPNTLQTGALDEFRTTARASRSTNVALAPPMRARPLRGGQSIESRGGARKEPVNGSPGDSRRPGRWHKRRATEPPASWRHPGRTGPKFQASGPLARNWPRWGPGCGRRRPRKRRRGQIPWASASRPWPFARSGELQATAGSEVAPAGRKMSLPPSSWRVAWATPADLCP